MKDIPVGASAELAYTVTPDKTVPQTYAEFPEFRDMPPVFATGLLVTLLETCCRTVPRGRRFAPSAPQGGQGNLGRPSVSLKAILPYLDWPREVSVGTHVNFAHLAATPPGMTVRVRAEVTAVQGRKVSFRAVAHDEFDCIAEGTHERHVIDAARFNARVAGKIARAGGGAPSP